MTQELPVHPNLEHLKAQAKDLLSAFRKQDPRALQRIRDSLPSARSLAREELVASQLKLHDMQSVIAREYGFASWANLNAGIQRATSAEAAWDSQVEKKQLPQLPEALQQALTTAATALTERMPWPELMPLIPLRDSLLVPGLAMPLFIGRAGSVAAVEKALSSDRLLVIFSQRRFVDESPAVTDLHAVGCVARVYGSGFMGDGTRWVVVRGQAWVRLESLQPQANHTLAHVSAFVVNEASTDQTSKLAQELRKTALNFSMRLPWTAESAQTLQRSTCEMADVLAACSPASLAEKAAYAAEPDLSVRMERALAFYGVQVS